MKPRAKPNIEAMLRFVAREKATLWFDSGGWWNFETELIETRDVTLKGAIVQAMEIHRKHRKK